MKQYKFIGTEQDLIDNGFYKKYDDLYVKLTNHPMFKNEKIGINIKNNYVGLLDTSMLRDTDQYNMRELIDKGLVVEVENGEMKTHKYEIIGFYDDIYPMTYTANTLDEAMKLKQKLERECFDRVEIKENEK